MADEVLIGGSQARAKVRNEWGVLGLGIITIGIYWIFWWYYINREMRDLGRATNTEGLGDNPGLSTVAFTIGGLVYVPFIWTIVTTSQRVQRSQAAAGVPDHERLNGWLAAVLWIFTLALGGPVFTQHHLNKVWRTQPQAALTAGGSALNTDLDRIEKLEQLRKSGALSDEEFEVEKARAMPPPPPNPEDKVG